MDHEVSRAALVAKFIVMPGHEVAVVVLKVMPALKVEEHM